MVVIAGPNARGGVNTAGRLMTEILVLSRKSSLDGEARAERRAKSGLHKHFHFTLLGRTALIL